MNRRLAGLTVWLVLLHAVLLPAAEPIRLHPSNPRYFLWRGRAVALVTSAEHYGMVLNPDLDSFRYLAALQADGMNYTRIFSGSYVEPYGAFGIKRNNLAPKPGRFLAPWARSTEEGYAGGGPRFDLSRWDPAYLERLKSFIAEAGRRGIVVELTLFSSTYGAAQWGLSPFNPANNVNGTQIGDWRKLHTTGNGNILPYQERLARYLARELNGFDNLFFEIQNEPWSDNHVIGEQINPYLLDRKQFPNVVEITRADSIAWQARIASAIADEESRLSQRHLIAQNISNFRLALRGSDLVPETSIANFHYAYPEAAAWNLGFDKVLGYDESGFAGSEDRTYRREAWNFMLSGGGLFNSLDYSFTEGREDGTDVEPNGPGGGSPSLRRQLRTLSEFLHSFDLGRLKPDPVSVRRAEGVVARTLSVPGVQYGIYLVGRSPATLALELPRGEYSAEWIDPVEGRTCRRDLFFHGGGVAELPSPEFTGEVAVRILLQPPR